MSCASCTWSRFNCHVFCCPCVNFGACIDLLNFFHTYINTYRRRRFCQCVTMLLAASSTLLYVSAFWPCCSGLKAHLCDAAMPCRLYWMNPLNYATKAIIINEFTASKLQKNSLLHAVCKGPHGQNWLPGLATPCPSYLPEPDTKACLPAWLSPVNVLVSITSSLICKFVTFLQPDTHALADPIRLTMLTVSQLSPAAVLTSSAWLCCRSLARRQAVPLRTGHIPSQYTDSGGWHPASVVSDHPLLVVLAGYWGLPGIHLLAQPAYPCSSDHTAT